MNKAKRKAANRRLKRLNARIDKTREHGLYHYYEYLREIRIREQVRLAEF